MTEAQRGQTPIFSDPLVLRKAPWPQLDTALGILRPGDTLVVCKLIRLGKSFSHPAETITGLHLRHIGFRSLSDDLDTASPDGEQITRIQELLDQPGDTINSVAPLFGVSRATIYRNVLGGTPNTGESSTP